MSVGTHIASVLRRALQRLKKRRFILRCEEEEEEEGGGEGGEGGGEMEVVVWGSEVLLLAPVETKQKEEEEGGKVERARGVAPGTPALKVSFCFLPLSLPPSSSPSPSPPSSSSSLELTLPVEEWHAVAALLEASAASDFPSSTHVPFAPARLAYLPLWGHGGGGGL